MTNKKIENWNIRISTWLWELRGSLSRPGSRKDSLSGHQTVKAIPGPLQHSSVLQWKIMSTDPCHWIASEARGQKSQTKRGSVVKSAHGCWNLLFLWLMKSGFGELTKHKDWIRTCDKCYRQFTSEATSLSTCFSYWVHMPASSLHALGTDMSPCSREKEIRLSIMPKPLGAPLFLVSCSWCFFVPFLYSTSLESILWTWERDARY